MSTFISTISIQTNSLTSDSLTVAILVVSDEKVFFQFSENKISLAEKIVSAPIKKHILHTLKLISEKVKEVNRNKTNTKNELFEPLNVFNSDYIVFLNNYSKGLIQFSLPKPIALYVNQEIFISLYEKFVGESLISESPLKNSFPKQINKILNNQQLKQKADINYVLKPGILKGIIDDTPVSLISQNGSITALQAVDFSIATIPAIVNKLNEFEITVNALRKLKKGEKGNYKIIVEEPELKTPQHKIFENVIKYKKDTYQNTDTESLNKIVEEIIENQYVKFSKTYT